MIEFVEFAIPAFTMVVPHPSIEAVLCYWIVGSLVAVGTIACLSIETSGPGLRGDWFVYPLIAFFWPVIPWIAIETWWQQRRRKT